MILPIRPLTAQFPTWTQSARCLGDWLCSGSSSCWLLLTLIMCNQLIEKKHSTETTLLKIVNDIYEGFDCCQSTILVALDQSATFRCVDHSTLVRRLHHTFGVTGRALDWLRLYLHSRSSFVRWRGFSSTTSAVGTGVPPGSSLGPLHFSLYIAPLSQVFQSVGVYHHQYADDT